MANSTHSSDLHQPIPNVPLVADARPFEVADAMKRSQDAFRAALPELLKSKTESQEWVAFCGNELVTFGRTKTDAYQECLRRGLKRGTFVVRSIEPETSNEAEILFEP